MARDKFFEARMQGMIYALNIARSKGIDELEKEIKMRNVLKAPLIMKSEQVEEFFQEICDNTRANTFAITFSVLHDLWNFGESRLQQFTDEFNKRLNACIDLDYMGEHYVKLEDFAIDIKKKYKNLIIDIQRVAVCQDEHDKDDPNFRNYKYIDGVINSLKLAGYYEAANYLESNKGK